MTDLVRVTFTGGPSGDWLSTFRIDRLLGGTAQNSVDTVRDFWSALSGALWAGLQAHVSGTVEVVDPSSGAPTGIDNATTRNITFTNGADALPFQTQAVVYWNTGTWISGRQVRGRTFVPGWCESSNTPGGGMDPSVVTVLGTAAASITSALTCTPGVYSKTHHNMFPIVGSTIPQKWAVLRTRR